MSFPKAITIAVAGLAFCQAGAATISEVLSKIAANNPELRSMAASNVAQELELRSENTLPPTSIEYSPFFRSGVGGVASSELIVSQEFDFPTLYASRSRQATLERSVLDGATAVRRQEVLLEARTALLDLIRLRTEEEILSARLNDTERLLALYERSLQLGQATQLDVNKTRLETQSIRRDILQNATEQADIEQTLSGLNGNRPMDLDGLSYDLPASELPLPDDPAAIVMRAAGVAEALAEVDAASHGAKLARSGWLPSLRVGYRRNTEEREASNGLLVGAGLPLFTNSSKVKAAEARLAAARLASETATMQATAEMQAELRQFGLQRELLETYDSNLIASTIVLYTKSLEAGQITLLTYYQETSALYDQLLTRVRLENDIQQTYSRLLAPLL